ncbi:regulator of chromosome condensation 1/beta-lactamase-inhibitor protein II [Aspergillus crustosus]
MAQTPTLFAFGSNGSGQLGIGHDEDVSVPTRCIFEEDDLPPSSSALRAASGFNDEGIPQPRVSRIVAGGNHTLVLLGDGRVYAAGERRDGRCGFAIKDQEAGLFNAESVFRRAIVEETESETVFDRFKGVSATWEGSILVSLSDEVFVLGTGLKGELGLGSGCGSGSGVEKTIAKTAVQIPDFPPAGTKVVAISSGMGHTVVVLSSGEVYGWGGARKGQLGDKLISEKLVWKPTRIEGVPFRVTDATCGREFTVLSGNRERGEFVVLGSTGDKWGILSGTPHFGKVNGFLSISASWHGVYVHQKDGSIFSWGRNDRGQLPEPGLRVVKEVAVGSEHVVALLEERSVVAWGWGEHGNCGPETDAQGNVRGVGSRMPIPEGVEVVGVGAGCATSWIMGV